MKDLAKITQEELMELMAGSRMTISTHSRLLSPSGDLPVFTAIWLILVFSVFLSSGSQGKYFGGPVLHQVPSSTHKGKSYEPSIAAQCDNLSPTKHASA